MSLTIFKNIYKILKENNFEIDNEINRNVLCTICNRIMIDARKAPCGCRYCYECITVYLNEEKKICPANTEDCKIELLNIKKNIHFDQPMNMKISRLILKCPYRNCGVRDELRRLEDHIRVCKLRSKNCPFSNLGCTNVTVANDKIGEHLLSENVGHTKLLLDCIGNMRNEMDLLKMQVSEVRLENVNLKLEIEKINGNQLVNDELRSVIALHSQDIDNLNYDMVAVRNVDRTMEYKINELCTKIETFQDANWELKNNAKKQISEIVQLNDKFGKMNDLQLRMSKIETKQNKLVCGNFVRVSEMQLEKTDLRRETGKIKVEMQEKQLINEELRYVIATQSQNIDNLNRDMKVIINVNRLMEQKLESLGSKIGTFESVNFPLKTNATKQICVTEKLNETCVEMDELHMRMTEIMTKQDKLESFEFVWKIDNFSDKRKKAQNGIKTEICSDPFYTHKDGYKIGLIVYPDGYGRETGVYLSVAFHIMRGLFDALLQWPFKHDVTLAIVNQQTGLDHCSDTIKFDQYPDDVDWNKPTTKRNGGFGPDELIKLDDLFNNPALFVDDQILIKCTVHKC